MASKRTSTDLVEGHGVRIRAAGVDLSGDLAVPPAVAGVVVFAHGTGSGRHSPRNQRVAARLQEHGFATLLLDLLTSREEQEDERTGRLRFDVGLLARRLAAAADWTRRECPSTLGLPVGYFGASTGAAAALIAAAEHPEGIEAIVSRGGRPDLALQHLGRVGAPTLLIVGQRDSEVSAMNETAFRELPVEKDLVIVPGAGHLFEEPGALDEVARLAADWFDGHLVAAGHTIGGARSAAGSEATMTTTITCEVCGNDYDRGFTVTAANGERHDFDSFECAIQALAPTCAHCGCRVLGHGVEAGDRIFCCAHCAREEDQAGLRDRA